MSANNKFDYLKFGIEDAQATIRFTDTKTAIAVSIVGAYIVGIFSIIEKISKYYSYYSFYIWGLLLVFLIFLVICTIVTARIIRPTYNPIKNITLNNKSLPRVPFYLGKNNYGSIFSRYRNFPEDKLAEPYDGYVDTIKSSTDDELLESLSFELLKVSYIRNIKNDRFNLLIKLLVISSILFVVFYTTFSFETEWIVKCGC